ncbi:MAG: aminoglycoside phosphotransferase family protein [Candidatus Komeilibacteria bacterium]|nr:aminoglycoside phosphotransferase family protein [Candidatus Komeilibacteria bacterium]
MSNTTYIIYKFIQRLRGRFLFSETLPRYATLEEKKRAQDILDTDFVQKYLNNKLPLVLPDFIELLHLERRVYKKSLGKYNTACVVRYRFTYAATDNIEKTKDLIFSSGTDGSRKISYRGLRWLHKQNFNHNDQYKIVDVLDFLPEQSCLIYWSATGKNLLYYVTQRHPNLTVLIELSAGWLKKIHGLTVPPNGPVKLHFIQHMIPRPSWFCYRLSNVFPAWGKRVTKLVHQQISLEKKLQKRATTQTVIYGDYHPENIIFRDPNVKRVKVIDFTDLSLGLAERDLGTFIQQFAFMSRLFLPRDERYRLKRVFLEKYFGRSYYDLPTEVFEKINLYQSWTALRSASFLFFSGGDQRLVFELIHDSERYMDNVLRKKRTINIK